MKRGDVIIVAVKGDHGKPRPALVVQNDLITEIDTVLVCLVTTSTEVESAFRFSVAASPANGLRAESYVMLDKTTMVLRKKCGAVIGRLSGEQMMAINERLAFVLGLAG